MHIVFFLFWMNVCYVSVSRSVFFDFKLIVCYVSVLRTAFFISWRLFCTLVCLAVFSLIFS